MCKGGEARKLREQNITCCSFCMCREGGGRHQERRGVASSRKRDGGDRPGCGRREERCWADSSLAQNKRRPGGSDLIH